MGICVNKRYIKNNLSFRKDEILIGAKSIPVKIVNKVIKSTCKIRVEVKKNIAYGTGFFLNYSEQVKYLITCYHIINPSIENENIEIEIYNNKKMKLNVKNRFTKYFNKPKDITIIEIKK